MNCFYHTNRSAVAQCAECKKGLCSECASKWEPPLCRECGGKAKELAKKSLGQIKFGFVAGIIMGLLSGVAQFAAIRNVGDFFSVLLITVITTVVCAYSFAALPVGWKRMNQALSSVNLKFILILPILGWIIYFCIVLMGKFIIGYMWGWFLLPKEYKRIKSVLNND